MSYYAKAIDAIDWPLGWALFSEQCDDCDEELSADTPVYYEPDGDMVGDPPRSVDCSTWLCVPCAQARGWA